MGNGAWFKLCTVVVSIAFRADYQNQLFYILIIFGRK